MSYLFSTGFTKISVLLFYRRLVTGTCSRRFKFCLWAAMALIVCYTLAYVILLLVTCIPLQATWLKIDPTYTKSYRCASTGVMTKVSELSGAFSVITDFYSVLLPAILLLQIKITRRQKLGLMAIFGVGFL
jgi:hypothetical protein